MDRSRERPVNTWETEHSMPSLVRILLQVLRSIFSRFANHLVAGNQAGAQAQAVQGSGRRGARGGAAGEHYVCFKHPASTTEACVAGNGPKRPRGGRAGMQASIDALNATLGSTH